jgi:hypothetical protein
MSDEQVLVTHFFSHITGGWGAGVAMRKAMKRSAWMLIATGILALAYYLGNRTGPSVPNETPSYDPADLAPPSPIAEESSMPDAESAPRDQLTNPNEGRRARIISVTAIHGMSQSRKNVLTSLPTIANGQFAERKPARIEVVRTQGLPAIKQASVGPIATPSILRAHQKDANNSRSEASTKRLGSGTPMSKPHAILSLSPAPLFAHAPVPMATKRRPLADEDVAWHVIETPGTSPQKGVPIAEQLFSREPEAATSENSATSGPNLDEPGAAPAQLTPTGKIVQARHEENLTHAPENNAAENNTAGSPVTSLPEVKPVIDQPRVLPRVLPEIQAIPLSDEPVCVKEVPQTRRASPAVQLTNTKVMSTSKGRPAPPASKSPNESIGVVFLESPEEAPHQLPAEVMESAPLMATQKLIARSLGSSDGVAANLAELRRDRPESPAGVILTGAVMEDIGVAKPYTTTGVVNFRTSKEEIAAQAHLDYVTSGLVILPAIEEPTITPPLAVQERLLKKTIRETCGDKVKNLDVAMEPNRSLKIRLQVANEADRKELSQTILAMPALSSYHIILSVHVLSET